MQKRFHRTCNLCEAMCGMIVTTEDDRVVDIRADRDDVFSRGYICPKGPAMREIQEDPDRLRQPMRRTSGGFAPISWEEAFDEVATRLDDVQRRHGRDSVATYVGNPAAHNHGAILMSQLFAMALGSKSRFDANSQDANPKLFASLCMFGEAMSMTVPDVDRTSFILMLGANPVASGGSIMSLGDVRGRLRAIRERGGRFVVIDPRRTETAEIADTHLAIRPGGDAALVLALIQVCFERGLVDRARVGAIARGVKELEAAVRPFSPERVSTAVGIPAETIRTLAIEFAQASSAVAYSRVGVCQSEFGPLATYLVEALNVITGNFDVPGGAMFSRPAIELGELANRLGIGGAGRFHSRIRKLPEIGGMLPAATMAEEMETPGPGQIRALVTLAGNPVLSVPSGERLARALPNLDFMVSIDIYLNETTKHAHIVLPPRYALERAHYDLVFHAIAVRNTVKWSEPVLPAPPGSFDDWGILTQLSARLAARKAFGARSSHAARWLARLGELGQERVIDALLRLGPYGDRFIPWSDGLNLAKVRSAPHGIDLGPLVPMREKRVRHPGGLVDLAPRKILPDVGRVERWLEPKRNDELVLIGRRHVRSCNSWMHNVHSLTKGPDRSQLLMHPDDAARRGLVSGRDVFVTSRAGKVRARLETTTDMMPGVVSLPHGFGHESAKDTLRIAGRFPGPNANAITDDQLVEPLTGTAILNGVEVEVASISAFEVVHA